MAHQNSPSAEFHGHHARQLGQFPGRRFHLGGVGEAAGLVLVGEEEIGVTQHPKDVGIPGLPRVVVAIERSGQAQPAGAAKDRGGARV